MPVTTHSIRHDDPHLFERSEVLSGRDAMHNPYLVITSVPSGTLPMGSDTIITQVRDIVALQEYPDNSMVLWLWPGKTRSDYFLFTVGEFKAAREAKRKAARLENGG